MEQLAIQLFENKQIRFVWDAEKGKYYFSVVDIVQVLTESPRPRVYWGTVKNRQKERFGQLYSKCIQLKLAAAFGNH